VIGYSGLTVDVCHEIGAQVIVRGLRVFSDFEYEFRMALANHRLAADIEVVALITTKSIPSCLRPPCAKSPRFLAMWQHGAAARGARALEKRFFELGEGQQVVPMTSLRD
jgi:pantetheine-phosphate adenylyltransferase